MTLSPISLDKELSNQEVTMSLQQLHKEKSEAVEAGAWQVPLMKPSFLLAERAINIDLLHPGKPLPSNTLLMRFIPGESEGWRW